MKKLIDRIARYILTVSGFTTSAVILLIIGFLFKEAVGLFDNPIVDDGYVLALNERNEVEELTAQQIKNIFDEEITNWQEVGGDDMPITVFRLEDLDKYYTEEELGSEYEYAGDKIAEQICGNPGIIAFVPEVLIEGQDGINFIEDKDISVKEVLLGDEWFPTATPSPIFGILPLIGGTLWVSFFAILIALPFGLAISIYLAEVADERTRKFLKPVIELLNGIPSVVYGFFGLARAGYQVVHTVEQAQESRFTASRRTDESHDLIVGYGDIDAFQRMEIAIIEVYILSFNLIHTNSDEIGLF